MKELSPDIDTLIFDFDGTIADTMELGIKISNTLANKFGYKQINSREELQIYRNKPTQEAIKAIGISKFKLPLIVRRFRKRLSQEITTLKPIDGVKAMIETLSSKYTLGIVTSNSERNIHKFLNTNQLEDHFQFFSTGIRLFKKHVTINQLIRRNNINKNHVLLIGDETRDVEAAKAVGIPAVAVSWGFHSKEVLTATKPEFLIHKPKELTTLLMGR